MTNQRWRVVKANAPTSSGKIWQVRQANQRRKVLHTWHEAMDYADRMSRTVEVTFPSKPGLIRIGRRTHVRVIQEKNGTALYVPTTAETTRSSS